MSQQHIGSPIHISRHAAYSPYISDQPPNVDDVRLDPPYVICTCGAVDDLHDMHPPESIRRHAVPVHDDHPLDREYMPAYSPTLTRQHMAFHPDDVDDSKMSNRRHITCIHDGHPSDHECMPAYSPMLVRQYGVYPSDSDYTRRSSRRQVLCMHVDHTTVDVDGGK